MGGGLMQLVALKTL